MNAVVKLVQNYPHTTLAIVGVLTVGLSTKMMQLRLSRLTTLQVTRAVEDLDLVDPVVTQMMVHGPYTK